MCIRDSNSSVPEVTGEAALRSDATDIDGIAADIRRVLGNAKLREELTRRGKEQAAKFSWDACARATLDVYRMMEG